MIRRSLLPLVLLLSAVAANAATFTVTSTNDSGPGTLREAIEAANSGACAAPCDIVFNIAGPPPEPGFLYFIMPLTPLPALTVPATIDGAKLWADTNPNGPEIVISGGQLCGGPSSCRGLTANAAVVFRNLIVSEFTDRGSGTGIGIFSTGPIAAEVRGCWIEANDTGIELRASGVTVAENIIRDNSGYGIDLAGGAGCNNSIRNNSIHSNGDLGISDTGPGAPPINPPAPCTAYDFPPVLETLTYDARTNLTTVTGSFYGFSGIILTLDFYTNSVPDPSGFGEGETPYETAGAVTGMEGRWVAELSGDLRHKNLVATTTRSSFSNVLVRTPEADLAVEHAVAPESAEAGSVVAYTLRVANHGPDSEPAAVLTITLSPGVTAQQTGSLSCSTSMNVLTCPLGEMPGGSARMLQLALRAPSSGTSMRHTAAIAGGLTDPTPANNMAIVETELREKSGRRRSVRH